MTPVQNKKQFTLFTIIGTLLIIATTGFVRMAYGVVLPYMQESMQLTFAEAGMLGTVLFFGYLASVGLAGVLAVRWGAKAVLLLGGASVVAGLYGLGLANSFWWAAVSMFFAGAGSAIVFTPLMSLMIGWFPDKRGVVTGTLLSGAGIGMIVSGMLVPRVIAMAPALSWRAAWLFFGSFALAVVLIAAIVLKNPALAGHTAVREKADWFKNKALLQLAGLYFLVGMAYLVPILYQTAYMVELKFSQDAAGSVFAFAGIFSIVGAPAWGAVSDRAGVQKTLPVVIGAAIVGNIVPLLFPNIAGFLLASVIWGTATGGMMALIQVSASQQVSPVYLAAAIGFISIFYAVGQMLGPGLAGWLISNCGGFAAAYLFGCAIYGAGLGLAYNLYRQKCAQPR